jgi:hypothetical protein
VVELIVQFCNEQIKQHKEKKRFLIDWASHTNLRITVIYLNQYVQKSKKIIR